MADLDDEKGSQQVGPDKPSRSEGGSESERHEPQHGAADPDSDIEQPHPSE